MSSMQTMEAKLQETEGFGEESSGKASFFSIFMLGILLILGLKKSYQVII